MGVVEQVVDGEVEAEAATVLQTHVTAYVDIDHEAALDTGLLGSLCTVDGAVAIVEDAAIGGEGGLVDSEGGIAVGIHCSTIYMRSEDVAQTAELREVYIYAVVIVDVGTQEPALDVVVHAEAQCGERCAAHAAAVGNHAQGILLPGDGILVGHGDLVLTLVGEGGEGIVDVLGVAHRGDGCERQGRVDIVDGCGLYAVVLLLDAVHREVGEASLAVVVEGGLLHLIREAGVVTGEAGGEVGRGERVGELVVEDALGGESAYKVVLDTVGHESVVGQGGFALVTCVEGEHVVGIDAP